MTTPVLPGLTVNTTTLPPVGGPQTSTGTAFVVGQVTSGPLGEVVPIRSMTEFVLSFGARLPASGLYDWLDTFFALGGRVVYVVGEAAGATSDATLTAALDALDPLLGEGQVIAPGRTTAAALALVQSHADTNNRTALIDAPDLATVAQLKTQADASALGLGARNTLLMDTWFDTPGITAGTTRAVPGSAVLAGRLALSDAQRGTGEFPAGDNIWGALPYVLGRRSPSRSRADLGDLNGAGVIVTRAGLLGGPPVIFGVRSLDRTSPWMFATAGRTRMALQGEADRTTSRTTNFGAIDGRGILLSDWQGALRDVCAGFWQSGALYGQTADDAFIVEVGPSVNPPAQIAEGIARAAISVRLSPLAERTVIDLTVLPITS